MISHKHKCIFIHISKCAGSSIEKSLGVNLDNFNKPVYETLYGWCPENKLFLQHATPDELIKFGYISKTIWNSYYKFIIVRNPWDRAYSDYLWMMKETKIKDNFFNFINKSGKFEKVLIEKNINYRGDHLNQQRDYFFLKNTFIKYDKILRFENLKIELNNLSQDLRLFNYFFNKNVNVNPKRLMHYSHFYNNKRRNILENNYGGDIDFLNYEFEDKKKIKDRIKLIFKS